MALTATFVAVRLELLSRESLLCAYARCGIGKWLSVGRGIASARQYLMCIVCWI